MVQRYLLNTTAAVEMPGHQSWHEFAQLLPRSRAQRLRTLLQGYRDACKGIRHNELYERVHTDPQRVRVHLLLLLRLLRTMRRPGL